MREDLSVDFLDMQRRKKIKLFSMFFGIIFVSDIIREIQELPVHVSGDFFLDFVPCAELVFGNHRQNDIFVVWNGQVVRNHLPFFLVQLPAMTVRAFFSPASVRIMGCLPVDVVDRSPVSTILRFPAECISVPFHPVNEGFLFFQRDIVLHTFFPFVRVNNPMPEGRGFSLTRLTTG